MAEIASGYNGRHAPDLKMRGLLAERDAPQCQPVVSAKASHIASSLARLGGRLSRLARLSPIDMEFLQKLDTKPIRYRPGEVLATEGATRPKPLIILSGWACTQRLLEDGRRQIFGFLLPSDVASFDVSFREPTVANVVALTSVFVTDATELLEVCKQRQLYPGLANAVALMLRQNETLLYDHIVRLGQQSAYERVAHILLELFQRLSAAGLAHSGSALLPLTQEILGDALGLSTIHVNRTLQQLRRDNLITLASNRLVIKDVPALAAIAGGPRKYF